MECLLCLGDGCEHRAYRGIMRRVALDWNERDARAQETLTGMHGDSPEPRWLQDKQESERDSWKRWV